MSMMVFAKNEWHSELMSIEINDTRIIQLRFLEMPMIKPCIRKPFNNESCVYVVVTESFIVPNVSKHVMKYLEIANIISCNLQTPK